jgi:putative membrane protein
MNVTATLLSALVAAALSASAYAQTGTTTTTTEKSSTKEQRAGKDTSKVDRGDRKFIEEAAQGGMMEVEAGKLAASKASDPAVKSFGDRMVKDHSKANDDLKAVAQKVGVTVPADMGKKHQKELDKLSKKQGADFDKEYSQHMLKDHKDDVNKFSKMSKNAKNPDLQQFASSTLPTLQEHLKMAQTLPANAGKAGSKNAGSTAGSTSASTKGSGSSMGSTDSKGASSSK